MTIRKVPSLYKYLSLEGILRFLKSPSLRYTQPKFLNDPYESHLSIDTELVVKKYKDYLIGKDLIDSNEAIKKGRNMENQLVIDALKSYGNIRNSLGVLSLSADPKNLLMWAHYGVDHTGVALELDIWDSALRPGSKGGEEYSIIEKVEYTDEKVFGLPNKENILKALSRKSCCWDYEKEWRLIRTLNMTREVKKDIYVVTVDLSSIKTVYFGANFDGKNLEKIITPFRDNGYEPDFIKLDISAKKFELTETDIEDYGMKLMHLEHHFGDAAAEAHACLPQLTNE